LQQDRNRMVNRIGRLLETANFKLGSVVSDIVGKTGWLILNAIAQGQTDPEQLAAQAQGSLRGKKAELAEALRGYSSEHFRWRLRELLEDVSRLDRKVNNIDGRLRERMQPHQDRIRRLRTIPGVEGDRRLDSDCRTRDRYESVSDRRACSELGGVVSGQLRKCRQAAIRTHP